MQSLQNQVKQVEYLMSEGLSREPVNEALHGSLGVSNIVIHAPSP